MDEKKGSTLDWTTEEGYWRGNYTDRPYIGRNRDLLGPSMVPPRPRSSFRGVLHRGMDGQYRLSGLGT